MIHLELGKARIFVRPGATDMPKPINGLVVLEQEEMQTSPAGSYHSRVTKKPSYSTLCCATPDEPVDVRTRASLPRVRTRFEVNCKPWSLW